MENIYNNIIKRNGYTFKCTCYACPEQYDVFYESECVAYVRKRWGYLTVNPVKNGNVIWSNILYSETDEDRYSGTIEDLDSTIDKITSVLDEFVNEGKKKRIWIKAR